MQYTRENAEKVMRGEKTQTRRPERDGDYAVLNADGNIIEVRDKQGRLKYAVDQIRAVQPGRGKYGIGHKRITNIRQEHAGDISEADAIAEGFDGVQGFIDIWTALYGAWTPEQPVWVLDFELVIG